MRPSVMLFISLMISLLAFTPITFGRSLCRSCNDNHNIQQHSGSESWSTNPKEALESTEESSMTNSTEESSMTNSTEESSMTNSTVEPSMTTYEMCIDQTIDPSLPKFRITSPRFGKGRYPSVLRCRLGFDDLEAPVVVKLDFTSFDVEVARDLLCSKNSFVVNTAVICGKWPQGKSLQFLARPSSKFMFSFLSHFGTEHAVFDIEVSVVPYQLGNIIQEYNGRGNQFGQTFYGARCDKTCLKPITTTTTTMSPTNNSSTTTMSPTTNSTTPMAPTTNSTTTMAPATNASSTMAPTTNASSTMATTTMVPTTIFPTTKEPTTMVPTTKAPTTMVPTTMAPTTKAPITMVPITKAPTTKAPITMVPITMAPTTKAPITMVPITMAPTTKAPITMAPITIAPTTMAPTTMTPTTNAPTTMVPSKVTPAVPDVATVQIEFTDKEKREVTVSSSSQS